jgi:hypothetical protein
MKYHCEVYAFGLGKRGHTRWMGDFNRLWVARFCTKIAAFLVDHFGDVHHELGIAWEIKPVKLRGGK